MNINKAFPSKHLKASDLDEDVVVTIKKLKLEEIEEGKPAKPVLYFEELEKGLVLNKTNATTISTLFGSSDTDDWMNKRIGLFVTMVEFKGQQTEGIRVKGRLPKADAKTVSEGRDNTRSMAESERRQRDREDEYETREVRRPRVDLDDGVPI